MKNILYVLVSFLLLSGCASQGHDQISFIEIIAGAKTISGDKNILISKIPTHGSLADSLAISVKGGGNAKQIRESIQQVINMGDATLVVTSVNPELAKAAIHGAIEDMDSERKNIILIYAGSIEFSEETKSLVESKGMKYGFVDTLKEK